MNYGLETVRRVSSKFSRQMHELNWTTAIDILGKAQEASTLHKELQAIKDAESGREASPGKNVPIGYSILNVQP